jgi:hypothetical protein
MFFKNGVKNIQAAAYNGLHTIQAKHCPKQSNVCKAMFGLYFISLNNKLWKKKKIGIKSADALLYCCCFSCCAKPTIELFSFMYPNHFMTQTVVIIVGQHLVNNFVHSVE